MPACPACLPPISCGPGGTALTKAIAGADTNALVKAVVTDFSNSEGRSAARDGLKAKFAASQPSDLKVKAIDSLRQVSGLLDAKAQSDAAAFKAWLRQISQITAEAAARAVVCLESVGSKLVTRKRQRLRKYQLLWAIDED